MPKKSNDKSTVEISVFLASKFIFFKLHTSNSQSSSSAFFFPGPRNARVIVELPVGTLNAKFKEMERTPNAIGQ